MKAAIAVAGIRPASFKLVEQAADSYILFRSSRRIGTARVDGKDSWSARFEGAGGHWSASARSGSELLDFVGRFLLTQEARAAAARPVKDTDPQLRVKGRKDPAEKLSLEFVRRAQKNRVAALDAEIAEMRGNIEPLPK